MAVFMCLGVALICLACVSTRLPWVLDKVKASAEKQFGPFAVYGNSNRAADLLCKHSLALVHSAVKEFLVAKVDCGFGPSSHKKSRLVRAAIWPPASRRVDRRPTSNS